MVSTIKLSNGGFTHVDDADFEFLNQFDWRSKKSDGSLDIFHAVRDVVINGKKITIRMHRLVTEANHDQDVFHIDGNGLNNVRRNLQLRTLKPWTGRPMGAGFRGVHQMHTNRWRAEISFAGRLHIIGEEFDSAKGAAVAYDSIARKLYGTNAVTNFGG